MALVIRPVRPADAGAIAEIYNHYVTDTVVTFEEEPVSVTEMERRIADVTACCPWFVSEEGGIITGYSYGHLFRPRASYRFTVETTVYLAPAHTGQGLGSLFFRQLLPALKEAGFHAVMAGITLPNPASTALHEKFGFEKVSHLKEVGFKFGRWLDVGYWEKLL